MINNLSSGVYCIEVIKAIRFMDEKYRFQLSSFNKNLGKNGRFFINRGAAGYISVAPSSVRVIMRVKEIKVSE